MMMLFDLHWQCVDRHSCFDTRALRASFTTLLETVRWWLERGAVHVLGGLK